MTQSSKMFFSPFLKFSTVCGTLRLSGRAFHRHREKGQKALSPIEQLLVVGETVDVFGGGEEL